MDDATSADRSDTMSYLAKSPTATHDISQLASSKHTYTIVFDRKASTDGYNDKTRTVTVNPRQGLVVKSSGKIQSPALGAAHEIGHAAEHDRIGTQAFAKNRETPMKETLSAGGGINISVGTSPEEKRETSEEGRIAHELGEPARKNYHDTSRTVRTCGATSTKQC